MAHLRGRLASGGDSRPPHSEGRGPRGDGHLWKSRHMAADRYWCSLGSGLARIARDRVRHLWLNRLENKKASAKIIRQPDPGENLRSSCRRPPQRPASPTLYSPSSRGPLQIRHCHQRQRRSTHPTHPARPGTGSSAGFKVSSSGHSAWCVGPASRRRRRRGSRASPTACS